MHAASRYLTENIGEIIPILISTTANINEQAYGYTPLMLATINPQKGFEIVQLLLKHPLVDVNLVNEVCFMVTHQLKVAHG